MLFSINLPSEEPNVTVFVKFEDWANTSQKPVEIAYCRLWALLRQQQRKKIPLIISLW